MEVVEFVMDDLSLAEPPPVYERGLSAQEEKNRYFKINGRFITPRKKPW